MKWLRRLWWQTWYMRPGDIVFVKATGGADTAYIAFARHRPCPFAFQGYRPVWARIERIGRSRWWVEIKHSAVVLNQREAAEAAAYV